MYSLPPVYVSEPEGSHRDTINVQSITLFVVELWGNVATRVTMTAYTRAEKFESFEQINSIRETNRNFDSCN